MQKICRCLDRETWKDHYIQKLSIKIYCFGIEKFQFDDDTYNVSTFGLTTINYFDLSIEEKQKVIQTEFPALVIIFNDTVASLSCND